MRTKPPESPRSAHKLRGGPSPPSHKVDSPSCGAFGAAAQVLLTAGLVPVPCGGETGKKPLIRYRNLDERMNQNFLTELLQDDAFRSAGVGVLTGVGQYPITVVDVDDPTALARVTELFGPTPIEIATPSDGRHLWYLSQGEGCANLRRHGLAVDIKGIGGFVVVPPTRRPALGKQGGSSLAGCYRFLRGSLDDLPGLPAMGEGGAALMLTASPVTTRASRQDREGRAVLMGERNSTCFSWALRLAPNSPDLAALVGALMEVNLGQCDPPLPLSEIRRVAMSAWGYDQAGRNWARSHGVVRITEEEGRRLRSAAALALLYRLRQAHGSRAEPFAVSPRPMAEAGCVLNLGERSIRQARAELVAGGFLELVHAGGAGLGDPSLYRLAGADLLDRRDDTSHNIKTLSLRPSRAMRRP